MNKIKFFIFTVLVLILQLTFLNKIKIYNTHPDLLLIAVIYFGLFHGPQRGFLLGLWCGLLEDIFSFSFFGVNTFLFALLGLVVGFLSGGLYRQSGLTQVLLVSISCIVLGLFFAAATGVPSAGGFTWFLMILPGSVYTGIIAPFFIFILAKLFKPLNV